MVKLDVLDKRNLTMLVDFYELTMANGYLKNGMKDKVACFDMFFRKVPEGGGFAIAAGLKQIIQYIKEIKFTDADIEYLKSKNIFCEEFLSYLRNFEFQCDVWAVPEGTPVFPNEPLVKVKGPIMQAQFIETMVLLSINHQTLIATKANRIKRAAQGREVLEFGSRRAQGYDGSVYGARAAYIGGVDSTSCTIAEPLFGVKASGTMAHSWVQSFDTEYDAFKTWAETYPDNCTFLVDTYNVLKSGIPNAIKVFKEIIVPKGYKPRAVRLDSGDLAYLSKKARKMLDEAGFDYVKIVASNSLDEYTIDSLLKQDSALDCFGVGERLITAKSEPVFGGVYKLVEMENNQGNMVPKIKISENEIKITNPANKKIYRLYEKDTGKAIADVLVLADEVIDDSKPYEIFHPIHTWKKKVLGNFTARPLLVQIFSKGKCVYDSPNEHEIRDYRAKEIATLWGEVLRFQNPHVYYVDLSRKLWELKRSLLEKYR